MIGRLPEPVVQAIEHAVTGGHEIQRNGTTYARRNLLDEEPLRALLESGALKDVTPAGFFAVRALLFDKTPGANWPLRWHQDRTVAVAERRDIPGFGPWTAKAGVVHAEAPVAILERMIALRIHLDASTEENGPLEVLPGSHRNGRATPVEPGHRGTVIVAQRGDVLLMSPLLVHRSRIAARPSRRRVLHLEYAGEELPGGLEWRHRI